MDNVIYQVRCKRESKSFDGVKVLNFTEGKMYTAHKKNADLFLVESDKGIKEGFLTLDKMFEIIN